jgi:hypothetical protein
MGEYEMRFIAHRGNTDGIRHDFENRPEYLEAALRKGFDVELDVRVKDGQIYLGHDYPQHKLDIGWMTAMRDRLWIHCKDTRSMEMMQRLRRNGLELNCFWHEQDTMTITSGGFLWVYPGKQPIENSIAVLPELHDEDVSSCTGICSDYVDRYREKMKKADQK